MVFAPHPDDDILGCGGTLAQHIQHGAEVLIVYMTSGDAERVSGTTAQELAHIREKEAKNGAAKVGISDLIFLRYPDGKLEASRDAIDQVVNLIGSYKPELVYIPHKRDAHKDHHTTFLIITAAINELLSGYSDWKAPLVLCYEVWTPLQKYTHKIDISGSIDIKLDALAEHKSQVSAPSSTNYLEAVKALNRYRGIMTWTGMYGECFLQHVPAYS